jgi:molybdate transport system ATP-binding protein
LQIRRQIEIYLDRLALDRAARPVLRLSWSIKPGERWLVVGANGAGKTQLLKVLAGDVWPNESAHSSRRYKLGRIWHEQAAEVRDEIVYLGPERQDKYERYGWNHSALNVVGTGLYRTDIPLDALTADDTKRSVNLLRRAGIAHLAQRPFLTLSYGERRLVLLARAWAAQAALVLLDEAASGLDDTNRSQLLSFLDHRYSRRRSWVYTAHRREDAPLSANRLLVLSAGRVKYAGRITQAALGRAFGRRPALRPIVERQAASPLRVRKVLLQLTNANVFLDEACVLADLNLKVRCGQCWVVHGPNGSGKSTLLRTLYGDFGVASGGTLERAGIVPGMPLEAFRARTGFVAPQLQTDHPTYQTVLETVASGLHSSIGLNFPITVAEKRRALAALTGLGLDKIATRSIAEISYGQMRRVLFARALVHKPRLLLLDEAFSGLDAATRGELLQNLDMQIAQGMTVVMATHYRAEWPMRTTHHLHLVAGRVHCTGALR